MRIMWYLYSPLKQFFIWNKNSMSLNVKMYYHMFFWRKMFFVADLFHQDQGSTFFQVILHWKEHKLIIMLLHPLHYDLLTSWNDKLCNCHFLSLPSSSYKSFYKWNINSLGLCHSLASVWGYSMSCIINGQWENNPPLQPVAVQFSQSFPCKRRWRCTEQWYHLLCYSKHIPVI